MKAIQRILLPLFGILAPWVIGVTAIQAAFLNDIRVGEYDTHTRIVFELSDTTVFERIISRKLGQLTVVFPNTQPKLIRKIPVEKSRRVQAVELLRRQDSLSVVLGFSFEHYRYELMEYPKPFRLVVDVYHLASSAESTSVSKEAGDRPKTLDAAAKEEQLPEASVQTPPLTQLPSDETMHPLTDQKPTIEPPAVSEKAVRPQLPRLSQPETQNPGSGHSTSPSNQSDGLNASQSTASDAKGLQYYLVVGMVIMTIVILILLLLMLIFKQPKTDDKALDAASNDLRKQDRRIAALNARIHEQLKRYDEA